MKETGARTDSNGRDERVRQMNLASLHEGSSAQVPAQTGTARRLSLDMMLDVPVTVVLEVGRTTITIRQLLEMNRGSFIELRNVSVDSIDVRINDDLVASGEAIALKQQYGVRVREVLPLTVVNEYEFQNT